MRPTDEQAIQERLEKATPGLWSRYPSAGIPYAFVPTIWMRKPSAKEEYVDNPSLIEHAPTDLTLLLARVQQLREDLDKYGVHKMNCTALRMHGSNFGAGLGMMPPCSCGYDQARRVGWE